MVLAATAIPVELRWPTYTASGFHGSTSLVFDALANILGYVPVGIVLSDLGPFRAVTTAIVLSIFAETAQLVMVHRDPSTVDVLANSVGAILGVAIACRWKIPLPTLTVCQGKSQIAALLAVLIVVGLWARPDDAPSPSGVTSPGRLEAYWKLDEISGRVVEDLSGAGLGGKFGNEPNRVDTVTGRVVLFDGAKDYVDFGTPTSLRLAGSMTVSAWIRSTSYPIDDAAIVSSYGGSSGYQLDTTIDTGPRTIGFKVANECGQLAARYGATPLLTDTWYHVSGVYDSGARTLDVFLNGELDNGSLSGSVTGAQHSSRSNVYIGKGSDWGGYEFAGFIRDVRIYSRALKAAEIVSDMRGKTTDVPVPEREAGEKTDRQGTVRRHDLSHARCALDEDKHFPIAAAAVGLLVAVAVAGLWPYSGELLWLVSSLVVGVLLPTSTLPAINLWLVPLTSLAGGASVAVSIRRSSVASRGRSY
jgi:Concanavalin A-like lectin/glucanases superfamily/VanZ like family